jgi:hypothetical protein
VAVALGGRRPIKPPKPPAPTIRARAAALLNPWATVAIALISALFGGVVTSWLTTRMRIQHEREEALRWRIARGVGRVHPQDNRGSDSLARLVDFDGSGMVLGRNIC